MSQSRGTDLVQSRNHRSAQVRALLRVIETLVSVSLAIVPISLATFATLTGV
jgi:hypothetical protein